MHGIEPDRLPEEWPVPGNPIRLEDLVEAVGEVIEAEDPNRGGRGEETRGRENPALARHGGRG
jgi:hypothetical protein